MAQPSNCRPLKPNKTGQLGTHDSRRQAAGKKKKRERERRKERKKKKEGRKRGENGEKEGETRLRRPSLTLNSPIRKLTPRVPVVAQWVKNLNSIHEDAGSIPGLPQ